MSDNKVNIVYRRNIANSPASKKEIEMAINDGVNFIELRSPKQLVFDKANKLIGLEVEITELIKDDNSTRLSFKSTGECETVPCDIVVEALGTNANYDYLKSFIPDLLDEAKRIMKAQASRGVDFNEGTFTEKIEKNQKIF